MEVFCLNRLLRPFFLILLLLLCLAAFSACQTPEREPEYTWHHPSTEGWVADGVGMVVTVKTASFGGLLTEMVGIDSEGAITGVKVTAHGDTKGLGTKAHDSGYLEQYKGLTELANADNIKGDSAVTFISGATISSNGVYQGVCAALVQFEAIGGAN